MKKIIAMLLACLMVVGLFAGCSSSNETPAPTEAPATDAAPVETTEAVTEAAPSGRVYWLNFKPESDEALKTLAAMYEEKTGVHVEIVTAASGTYNETRTAEMDKSAPPTIFVVGNSAAVQTWGEYCMDLNGTPIANELNTDAYMLYDEDGKL